MEPSIFQCTGPRGNIQSLMAFLPGDYRSAAISETDIMLVTNGAGITSTCTDMELDCPSSSRESGLDQLSVTTKLASDPAPKKAPKKPVDANQQRRSRNRHRKNTLDPRKQYWGLVVKGTQLGQSRRIQDVVLVFENEEECVRHRNMLETQTKKILTQSHELDCDFSTDFCKSQQPGNTHVVGCGCTCTCIVDVRHRQNNQYTIYSCTVATTLDYTNMSIVFSEGTSNNKALLVPSHLTQIYIQTVGQKIHENILDNMTAGGQTDLERTMYMCNQPGHDIPECLVNMGFCLVSRVAYLKRNNTDKAPA